MAEREETDKAFQEDKDTPPLIRDPQRVPKLFPSATKRLFPSDSSSTASFRQRHSTQNLVACETARQGTNNVGKDVSMVDSLGDPKRSVDQASWALENKQLGEEDEDFVCEESTGTEELVHQKALSQRRSMHDSERPTKRHKFMKCSQVSGQLHHETEGYPLQEPSQQPNIKRRCSEALDDGELLVSAFDDQYATKIGGLTRKKQPLLPSHDATAGIPRQVQVVAARPRGKNISAVARAMARSSPVPALHPTHQDTKVAPRSEVRGKDFSAMATSLRPKSPPRDIEIDANAMSTPTSPTRPLLPIVVSADSAKRNVMRQGIWSDDDDDDFEPLSIHFEPFTPLPTLFPYQEYLGFSDYGGNSRSVASASTFATMSSFPTIEKDIPVFDHLADDLKLAANQASTDHNHHKNSSRQSASDMSVAARSKNDTSTIHSGEMSCSLQSKERSLASMKVDLPLPPESNARLPLDQR
ncbi:expressed unknown protein [Seminavis robusta]|uniref:Uncharacterized protein n=1 Tax=Seminavis robusta TaxID=568900 RepID=A0A9N8HT36_9STRA|nr:expressed unknown protein [Seminavis robusta]|eukprot:Sro1815_g299440.1 n/a (470) ;mRNA; r:19885-21294